MVAVAVWPVVCREIPVAILATQVSILTPISTSIPIQATDVSTVAIILTTTAEVSTQTVMITVVAATAHFHNPRAVMSAVAVSAEVVALVVAAVRVAQWVAQWAAQWAADAALVAVVDYGDNRLQETRTGKLHKKSSSFGFSKGGLKAQWST